MVAAKEGNATTSAADRTDRRKTPALQNTDWIGIKTFLKQARRDRTGKMSCNGINRKQFRTVQYSSAKHYLADMFVYAKKMKQMQQKKVPCLIRISPENFPKPAHIKYMNIKDFLKTLCYAHINIRQ